MTVVFSHSDVGEIPLG